MSTIIKFGDIEIIDDNGWNLNDTLPEHDWEVEEVDMKITPDFGCGVRVKYKEENYTFKHNPRRYSKNKMGGRIRYKRKYN